MATVPQMAQFDLACGGKRYHTYGVIACSFATTFMLAYEWAQAYSADTKIFESRLGWVLMCTAGILVLSLLELLHIVCWIPTDMNTRKRVAADQIDDSEVVPDRHSDPLFSNDGCFCCYSALQSENAVHLYKRRRALVRQMLALDSLILFLAICSVAITSISRLVMLAFYLVFITGSFVWDCRMKESMNFWFADELRSDVVVLQPPRLRKVDIQHGFRVVRGTFAICIAMIVLAFAVQNYYLFAFQQTLIESKRLLVVGTPGYIAGYTTEQSLKPFLAQHPRAEPVKVWTWVWDGLPCERVDDLPMRMECLAVSSPDVPDVSWYSLATGIEPYFLGRQFTQMMYLTNDRQYSLENTEVTSDWQDAGVLQFISPSVVKPEEAFAPMFEELIHGNGTFAVTRIRSRPWKEAVQLFQQAFAYWLPRVNEHNVVWIITASHSQSADSLQRYGGIVPSRDRMRSFVPWFTRVYGEFRDGVTLPENATLALRKRPCVGTTADVYPTIQALRLKPLSVFSTGSLMLDTVQRQMQTQFEMERDNVTMLYLELLQTLRGMLRHHATLSVGIQSTNEIMNLVDGDEDEGDGTDDGDFHLPGTDFNPSPRRTVTPNKNSNNNNQARATTVAEVYAQQSNEFRDWLSSLRTRYIPMSIVRNVLVSLLLSTVMLVCLSYAMISHSLRPFTFFRMNECEMKMLNSTQFSALVDASLGSLFYAFAQTATVSLVGMSISVCVYAFYYHVPWREFDFSLLHADGAFNGLMVFFWLVICAPAVITLLVHALEWHFLYTAEVDPRLDPTRMNSVTSDDSATIESDTLLNNVWKETIQARETQNVWHYLLLHGFMLTHILAYGILWCLQAGYMSPLPLLNPSWLFTEESVGFAWIMYNLQWILLPQSLIIVVRSYRFQVQTYCLNREYEEEAGAQLSLQSTIEDTMAARGQTAFNSLRQLFVSSRRRHREESQTTTEHNAATDRHAIPAEYAAGEDMGSWERLYMLRRLLLKVSDDS